MQSRSSPLTSKLAAEEDKLLACIHCGLCLEACPTYVITGDENDGPRGRLYLMRAVGEERLSNTSTAFEQHIDRCLGCRACEQVCPAGVEYGQLLEAARAELFTAGVQRGFAYHLLRFILRHVWLQPARLRFAFAAIRLFRDSGVARLLRKAGIARLISRRLEFSLALLESSSGAIFKEQSFSADRTAQSVSAQQTTADELLLFTGCVGAGLFARVNRATKRVLEANGFVVQVPANQMCCGALHAHAGDLEAARILARRNIEAFSEWTAAPIITNAGGCGAMLAGYGHLLAGDESFAAGAQEFSARIRDVSEQLKTIDLKSSTNAMLESITYDASCHLLYGQHVGEAPLEMLSGVSQLNFVRLEGAERCCGGAGVYNLLEPDLSRQVLDEKLARISETGARILATGNPGCQMQIGAGALVAGIDLKVCHPVELLDESYARAGMYSQALCTKSRD